MHAGLTPCCRKMDLTVVEENKEMLAQKYIYENFEYDINSILDDEILQYQEINQIV